MPRLTVAMATDVMPANYLPWRVTGSTLRALFGIEHRTPRGNVAYRTRRPREFRAAEGVSMWLYGFPCASPVWRSKSRQVGDIQILTDVPLKSLMDFTWCDEADALAGMA